MWLVLGEGGMSKIRVGDEVIDISLCFCITIKATEIHFESDAGGSRLIYKKGTDLSDANFNTLSAWLTNQTNNPYTVVV